MAPKAIEAVAGPAVAAKDFKKESNAARILGSGSAGIAELAIFHPVDTIAKRLMSNEGKISPGKLNHVIFKDKATASIGTKFRSLFPGLGYAAGYKVRNVMRTSRIEGFLTLIRYCKGFINMVVSHMFEIILLSIMETNSIELLAKAMAKP